MTFEQIKMVDNYYQTSSFFPMPIVAITTITEDGKTNIGPYSLCFPYYVVGMDYYAMLLNTRNQSNTAKNILRTKKCNLNFIPDDKKFMKQCVALGFPGDTTDEKMKDCIFNLIDGSNGDSLKIIEEAFQVFECTWMCELDNADKDAVQESYSPPFHDFNGITSEAGAHFILRIDKILLKPEYKKSIIEGVTSKNFPKLPVDYGFRENTSFWFASFKRPYSEDIPKDKEISLDFVRYAVDRIQSNVKFTDEACEKLVKVPKIFLKKAIKGCVEWAEKRDIKLITLEHMDKIRDKRSDEK